MDRERWKEIPGFDDYFVSTFGRVRSFRQRSNGRCLAFGTTEHGYYFVNILGNDKKLHVESVHYLVCLAFRGPRKGRDHVRHLDGNKINNYLYNLVYGTSKQNGEDTRRNHRYHLEEKKADQNMSTILRLARKKLGLEMLSKGKSLHEVARAFGVNASTVFRWKEGKSR